MFAIRKSEIPVALLLLPFITGIGLGLYIDIAKSIHFVVIAFGISALTFLLFNVFYNRFKAYKYSWLGGFLLHISLVLAGWLCLTFKQQLHQANHFSKNKAEYLIIKAVAEPRRRARYFRFVANVENTVFHNRGNSVCGKLLITIVADSNSHPVKYGDVLLIPASYKLIDPPFNPAEFNYKQYLARQNIYHQSFITARQLVKISSNQGNPVIAYALLLRQQMVQAINTHMQHMEEAAVASTLILGYKADLSPDIVQSYSKTGTIHVLSVSGAHVAVIFWFISFLLKPLSGNRYGRWLNALLSLLLIWGYALLTGFSPAVCRAAVMISMLIISKTANRQVHGLNVLAISAFALLLYDPLLITDVGFQLSYLAVLGLIVLHPFIVAQFEIENKWLSKLWQLCSASLAAQIITFPLSAYYFHQFPVYFLISNLFIILPSEAIMITGMLFLLLSFVPGLSTALVTVTEYTILLMNKGLAIIEHIPYSSIGKIWLTPIEHVLLYLLIGMLLTFLILKKKWPLTTSLLAMLVLCISVSFKAITKQNSDHVLFLNLKKHSGILINSGKSAVVITDLAVQDKDFQYSIQPCLDSLQVDDTQVVNLRQSLHNRFMQKQFNLFQFKNKTVLIFDRKLEDVQLNRKLAVNYLFITGSPQVNLAFILKNYAFETLILDAGNSKHRTEELMAEASKLHLKIFSLRRNKALAIVSN